MPFGTPASAPPNHVCLHTEWGEARSSKALVPRPPSEWDSISLLVPDGAWHERRHPKVRFVTFTDRGGSRWRQDETAVLPERQDEASL